MPVPPAASLMTPAWPVGTRHPGADGPGAPYRLDGPEPTIAGGRYGPAHQIVLAVEDLRLLAGECEHQQAELDGSARRLTVLVRNPLAQSWGAPDPPGTSPAHQLGSTVLLAEITAWAELEAATTSARLGSLAWRLDLAARRYELTEQLLRRRWEPLDTAIREVAGQLADSYPQRPPRIAALTPLPAAPAPTGLADLLAALDDQADGGPPAPPGRVDIRPTGTGAYVVALPGTSNWAPPWAAAASPDIRNLPANLRLVAGQGTAELTALPDVLARAGVPTGATLVLVGHSQGGLTAYAAAADARLRQQFRVSHVITAGSPVAGMPAPPGVRVLSLEHRGDLVPRLDGHPNPARADHVTVRFGKPGGIDLGASHATSGYRAAAAWADRSTHPDLAEFRASLAAVGVRAGTEQRPAPGVRVVLELADPPTGATR